MIATRPPAAFRAGKYVIFVLGAKQYGVEILRVREIIGASPITPIPQAPHYVKGVINLRDNAIPVVDIRAKLGMPERENTPETYVIVVDADGKSFGLLADTVKGVVDIRE